MSNFGELGNLGALGCSTIRNRNKRGAATALLLSGKFASITSALPGLGIPGLTIFLWSKKYKFVV